MVGESNVPLTRDLKFQEKETKPFIKTKSEWAADNRQQIIERGLSITAADDFFTVPDNQILFITGFTAAWQYNGGVAGHTALNLSARNPAGGDSVFLVFQTSFSGDADSSSYAMDFSMPLKINPNSVMRLTGGNASGDSRSSCVIFGYLQPLSISFDE